MIEEGRRGTGSLLGDRRGPSSHVKTYGTPWTLGLARLCRARLLTKQLSLILLRKSPERALHHGHGPVDEPAAPAPGQNPAEIGERVQVAANAAASVDAVQQPGHLHRAAFAGRTLAAGAVRKEVDELRHLADDAGPFGDHDHGAGAEPGLPRA